MSWPAWLPRRASFSLGVLAGFAAAQPASPMHAEPSPQQAWASVLHDRVDGEGRVDFTGIQRDPALLDAYVSYVAATAPEGFAVRQERLAFLINSYNALSMGHVVRSGIPERLSLLGRLRFFKLTHVVVGGRRLSLYDYENDVIRPMDEERVHFVLNCMSVSCPRLPRTPFTAAALDRQLDAAARQFFAEPRNVQVDDARHVVRLSAILDFYATDFLRHAPGLIAYVNRYRAQPLPMSYRVEFLEYDWTINRQPSSR